MNGSVASPLGYHTKFKTPDGFKISIVSNPLSYGGKMGLFEVAVYDKQGELVGGDVFGYLSFLKVAELLKSYGVE